MGDTRLSSVIQLDGRGNHHILQTGHQNFGYGSFRPPSRGISGAPTGRPWAQTSVAPTRDFRLQHSFVPGQNGRTSGSVYVTSPGPRSQGVQGPPVNIVTSGNVRVIKPTHRFPSVVREEPRAVPIVPNSPAFANNNTEVVYAEINKVSRRPRDGNESTLSGSSRPGASNLDLEPSGYENNAFEPDFGGRHLSVVSSHRSSSQGPQRSGDSESGSSSSSSSSSSSGSSSSNHSGSDGGRSPSGSGFRSRSHQSEINQNHELPDQDEGFTRRWQFAEVPDDYGPTTDQTSLPGSSGAELPVINRIITKHNFGSPASFLNGTLYTHQMNGDPYSRLEDTEEEARREQKKQEKRDREPFAYLKFVCSHPALSFGGCYTKTKGEC